MKDNIILKKIGYLFLIIALSTTAVSCDQESVPDDSNINLDSVGMRGIWVVDMYWDGELYDHNTINTYNTSDNGSSAMWIDDLEHSWGLKTKVDVNSGALTFSGTDLDELYYGVTVTITEGKIVRGGATTPSGDVVDSIYFKAEFSDIPGEIWEYSGYRSTSKVDDLP